MVATPRERLDGFVVVCKRDGFVAFDEIIVEEVESEEIEEEKGWRNDTAAVAAGRRLGVCDGGGDGGGGLGFMAQPI